MDAGVHLVEVRKSKVGIGNERKNYGIWDVQYEEVRKNCIQTCTILFSLNVNVKDEFN